MNDKDFFEDIDLFIKKSYFDFQSILKANSNIVLINVELGCTIPEDILHKYNLNTNIQVSIKVLDDRSLKVTYYYKGYKLDPDCYYLRPDNYTEVSVLDILAEAIKQDTYRPDIKFLEARGNKVTKKEKVSLVKLGE